MPEGAPPPPGGPPPGQPGSYPPTGEQPAQPQAPPAQPGAYQQPQPGWQTPPGGPWYGPPPPPAIPQGPGNDAAVAGLVLSCSGAALLLFSSGFASPVTLILGILGIVFGRKGKSKIDRGETVRHRSLAQAGFIVGIVAVVLSILAICFWGAIIIIAIVSETSDGSSTDPDFFETELAEALLRAAAALF
jgi:hypothetical protein